MSATSWLRGMQEKAMSPLTLSSTKRYYVVSEKIKYGLMAFFSLLVLASALVFNPPRELASGFYQILFVPGILVTDYMQVGNVGAALLNAGLLMLVCIAIAALSKVNMSGPVVAAVFTVGGFALFGKTMFNIWPIIAGVYLYACYRKDKFSQFLLPALFGTALGPLVSQIAFGFDLPAAVALPLSLLVGLMAGFCLPAMANHFVVFHQGFNLYNIGFTCGIAGLLAMSMFRAFGMETAETMIVFTGEAFRLGLGLLIYFVIMLVAGLFFTRQWIKGVLHLWRQPGRLVSDFVATEGFGPSLINMALIGMVSTAYVLFVSGELNGPIIGGIFTVVGFGAFGKHVRNILPILAGVFLASLLNIWEPSSTGALLAALFGTTLAPIAGTYGIFYGVVAGFVHMSVVMNVGYLHGGMNLYNNGFAGGFVAAILIPIFDAVRSRFNSEENGSFETKAKK